MLNKIHNIRKIFTQIFSLFHTQNAQALDKDKFLNRGKRYETYSNSQ